MEKNKLYKQRYNAVMNRLGAAVKKILESYDDSDLDGIFNINESVKSKIINEMAVTRAVNSKSYANVRDAVSRHNYDEEWAKTVPVLSKFDDTELLHRYVSALLVFGKNCPQTEDDIDDIGVYANYAHKYIEDGGSLSDIIDLYSKNDKVQPRKRVGTTRGTKGAKKAQQKPSEDFDFDNTPSTPKPQNNEPEAEFDVYKPEPDDEYDKYAMTDTDEIPRYEDVGEYAQESEPEPVNIPRYEDDVDDNSSEEAEPVNTEEIPRYEDAGDEGDEEPIDTEEIPRYTGGDDDNDEPVDIPRYEDVGDDVSNANSGEVREFDILDLTLEDLYDPEMNASYINYNDDVFLSDGDQIGFNVKITDDETGETEIYELFRDDLGSCLETFDIVLQAALNNNVGRYVSFEINPVVNKFFRQYRDIVYSDDDLSMSIDEKTDKFALEVFASAENLSDITDAIDKM